ncbi:MAG: hypothetical protein ABEJ23_03650 [Haloarculaceae archaeon]
MSRHSRPSTPAALPDVVPLALPVVTRLSWDLGERITGGEDASLRGAWRHARSPRTLELYDVTAHTAVLKLRSPVGRERFYGVPETDVDRALPALAAAGDWQRWNEPTG